MNERTSVRMNECTHEGVEGFVDDLNVIVHVNK